MKSLREGIFLQRLNRFVAEVEVEGKRELAHVPSSGRMRELLTPGRRLFLVKANRERKTAWGIRLVDMGELLVSIDSLLPNKLILAALQRKGITGLGEYQQVIPEYTIGESRFDFYLSGSGAYYLEVKSVTLVEDGVALFPDAPTKRGTKHLEHLRELSLRGMGAGVIFVVQRSDALCFMPNSRTDPEFATALKRAWECGVEVRAYTCTVALEGVSLKGEIPVKIG